MEAKENLIKHLKDLVDKAKKDKFGHTGTIYPSEILNTLDDIKQNVFFDKIENFEITDNPFMENENGDVFRAVSWKLDDEPNPDTLGEHKYYYLYSISKTPEIYDPKEIHKPVKDGMGITPTVYDPISFTPKRTITIEYSPELAQDVHGHGVEERDFKNELHDKLDRLLDSPEEYRVKGKSNLLVRGVVSDEPLKKLESSFVVFCLEKNTLDDKSVNFQVVVKFIKKEYIDEFKERFSDYEKGININAEDVDKFLEEKKSKKKL